MAYCRFGPDSDLYILDTGLFTGEPRLSGLWCCGCQISVKDPHGLTAKEMIEHVTNHVAAGHKVPTRLLKRLYKNG
jgi:hypothetical protein